MVDVTEMMQSPYLNAEFVQNSTTKEVKFITEGKIEDTEWGKKLTFTVKIGEFEKIWRLNRDSIKNLSDSYGKDSGDWCGKMAVVRVITIAGKKTILATPLISDGKDSENEKQ